MANLQYVMIASSSDIVRRFTPRTGIGVAARIVQATEVVIPHLSFDSPGILRITHGKKRIRYANRVAVFDQGDIALFGGGYSLDVINEPGDSGLYRAEAIFFDREFLSQRPACPDRNVDGHATIQGPGHSVATALSSAIDAMEDSQLPDPVVAHRVNEVMIWLSVFGYYLAAPSKGDLPARVRQLLASDPSRDWPAVEVALAMATSEPTLRRKLSAAGTTLSAILLDIRMSNALSLLQATDDPISTIALLVGYESPSRFAQRFRERFGFQPSEIRQRKGD